MLPISTANLPIFSITSIAFGKPLQTFRRLKLNIAGDLEVVGQILESGPKIITQMFYMTVSIQSKKPQI